MILLGAPASRRPVRSREPELAGGTPALPGTAPLPIFHFISQGTGVKVPMSYDETCFATSRAAAPEIAAFVQGFDAIQTFQSAHVFPRVDLEGTAHAAHRPAAPPRFPEADPRPGRHHLDRPRVVFDSIHGFERFD